MAGAYFKPMPSEISYGRMRFVITDRPSKYNMKNYLGDLERYSARALVRVCEPTYETGPIQSKGIDVLDWEFVDGHPPPQEIIDKWLVLVKDVFSLYPDKCIVVHCVAGLGRAPSLVAIALMEGGMKYEDAVNLIRKNRRGALNQKQLQFLQNYKASGKLKKMRVTFVKEKNKSCCIA